jgi:hypothetical protein
VGMVGGEVVFDHLIQNWVFHETCGPRSSGN